MNTPKRAACEKIFFVSELNLTRWMGLHVEKLFCSNQQLRQKNTWCYYAKFEKITELCRKKYCHEIICSTNI